MSEFSPDTIQFEASTPQSLLYQEFSFWLGKTQHPVWKHWIQTQREEEALSSFSKDLQLPLHLSTLQNQIRILNSQITESIPQANTLRQLLHNWQKQTEALILANKAAYDKSYEERENLSQHLAETEWPASFLNYCHQIEIFLEEQVETHFQNTSNTHNHLPRKAPKASIRLKESRSGFILPSELQANIFQRSPKAWLRRAARYLQIAWKEDFSDKKTLKKLLKSLYAALEQEPDSGAALLLLGWIFACMGQSTSAMVCLERLRTQESPSEMIFLIRFLQNRPVL